MQSKQPSDVVIGYDLTVLGLGYFVSLVNCNIEFVTNLIAITVFGCASIMSKHDINVH
jgi:hypothetical protein